MAVEFSGPIHPIHGGCPRHGAHGSLTVASASEASRTPYDRPAVVGRLAEAA